MRRDKERRNSAPSRFAIEYKELVTTIIPPHRPDGSDVAVECVSNEPAPRMYDMLWPENANTGQ